METSPPRHRKRWFAWLSGGALGGLVGWVAALDPLPGLDRAEAAMALPDERSLPFVRDVADVPTRDFHPLTSLSANRQWWFDTTSEPAVVIGRSDCTISDAFRRYAETDRTRVIEMAARVGLNALAETQFEDRSPGDGNWAILVIAVLEDRVSHPALAISHRDVGPTHDCTNGATQLKMSRARTGGTDA
ncbi:MAG: hypothetical protein AAF919_05495 [Pseudomonadota bacterium]